MDGLEGNILSKWMVLGYHYFRKASNVQEMSENRLPPFQPLSLRFGLTGSIRNEAMEKGQFQEVEAGGCHFLFSVAKVVRR